MTAPICYKCEGGIAHPFHDNGGPNYSGLWEFESRRNRDPIDPEIEEEFAHMPAEFNDELIALELTFVDMVFLGSSAHLSLGMLDPRDPMALSLKMTVDAMERAATAKLTAWMLTNGTSPLNLDPEEE